MDLEGILHKLMSDLIVLGLESVWIEITTDDESSYLLCSMYRLPSSWNCYFCMMIVYTLCLIYINPLYLNIDTIMSSLDISKTLMKPRFQSH